MDFYNCEIKLLFLNKQQIMYIKNYNNISNDKGGDSMQGKMEENKIVVVLPKIYHRPSICAAETFP